MQKASAVCHSGCDICHGIRDGVHCICTEILCYNRGNIQTGKDLMNMLLKLLGILLTVLPFLLPLLTALFLFIRRNRLHESTKKT